MKKKKKLKRCDVNDYASLHKYCNTGLAAQPSGIRLVTGVTLAGLSVSEVINLKRGFIAKKVHTSQATTYWLIFYKKGLVHICDGGKEGFKKAKEFVYTIRRLSFNNKTSPFLKSPHERELEKREDAKENLKILSQKYK